MKLQDHPIEPIFSLVINILNHNYYCSSLIWIPLIIFTHSELEDQLAALFRNFINLQLPPGNLEVGV